MLRHIVENVKCRTAFATHYHMLCDEMAGKKAVALNHMSCVVDDEKCVFGTCDVSRLFPSFM